MMIRVIPAHAGSTGAGSADCRVQVGHPRSRGVNTQQTPESRQYSHPSSGH